MPREPAPRLRQAWRPLSAGQLLLEGELALPLAVPLAAQHPLPSRPGDRPPRAPPLQQWRLLCQLRPLHLHLQLLPAQAARQRACGRACRQRLQVPLLHLRLQLPPAC